MLPNVVVGVTTVGVDGSEVRSANARVPFRARFIAHGVEPGAGNPWTLKCKFPVSLPHAFVAVSVMVNDPGSVGMPVMFPLVVFIDKPRGRLLELKVSGLWFVLKIREHGAPAGIVSFI